MRIIYFFSGTGNSHRAATTIAKALGGAQLVSVTCDPRDVPATDADIIGFVSPVYEWDVPGVMKKFLKNLEVNPNAYIFAVSTYVMIHGRSFETVEKILSKKGAHLSYGRGIFCVASQCTAYTPFPPTWLMRPIMERQFRQTAEEIAAGKTRPFPRMSAFTRRNYKKRMAPYMAIESEYDLGFYTSEDCVHCGICAKVCPLGNIKMVDGSPSWHNTVCHGCNACTAYCPRKAILYSPPEAYVNSGLFIAKHVKLDKKRKRYHHPDVTYQEIMTKNKWIEHDS